MGVLSQPPPPSRDDDPTTALRRGGKYRGSGGRSQAPSTEEPMVPPWTPSFSARENPWFPREPPPFCPTAVVRLGKSAVLPSRRDVGLLFLVGRSGGTG